MEELEIILAYIEKGGKQKKAEGLLKDDRWQLERKKLERTLALLENHKDYETECPDHEEAVRFYYGQLPPEGRESFIGHLIHCQGSCIDTLLSLRESEREAAQSLEEKPEVILEELRNQGLISEGLLLYINSENERAEQIMVYDFLRRYGATIVALALAGALQGRALKAGGEDVGSVVKESDDFQVEVYPSPQAPGRLEAEIDLKADIDKAGYEGAELLVFVQAGKTGLSAVGSMKDGKISGLALSGPQVGSDVFSDPEQIIVEVYIGKKALQ